MIDRPVRGWHAAGALVLAAACAAPAGAAVIFDETFTAGYSYFPVPPGRPITLQSGQDYVDCCAPIAGSPAARANRFVAFGAGNVSNGETPFANVIRTIVRYDVGTRYRLTFDTASLGSDPSLTDSVYARVINTTGRGDDVGPLVAAGVYAASASQNLDTAFVTRSLEFTETNPAAGFFSIEFSDAGAGTNVDAAVDNIRLESDVPEPAAWVMIVTGFGLIGATWRWRRRGAVVQPC